MHLKNMLENSQKEVLISSNDDPVENGNNSKVPHLNDVSELVKYFPDFKECKTLQLWGEDYDPVRISRNRSQKTEDKFIDPKWSFLETLGFLAGLSILYFPIAIIIIAQISWILVFIIYIILVILQFFNPVIKDYVNSKDNEKKFFEEFEKNINEMVKTNVYFENEKNKKEGIFEFILKNSIDISGELDMTKPPKFYVEEKYRKRRKIINSGQQKLKDSVSVVTCIPRIYTIDKQTEKKLELYIHNYGFLSKNPNIGYSAHFYRNFNRKYLISIPLLFSSLYFDYCSGTDLYYIEPRKIISCEDLDNNYNLSICSNFKPKYTFYTGEQINFKENCIINKADEEKLKIFNENYFIKLGQEEGFRDKLIEKGLVPNKVLYNKKLGNLSINVFINKYYIIECELKYDLQGVAYSYTTGRNDSIITDDVHLECEKEGLEKEGELNYLYIKYLEEPFIIGNYEALSFGIQYKTSKFFFGPEVIYV